LIWVELEGLEVEVTVPPPRPRALVFFTARLNFCRVNEPVGSLAVKAREAASVTVAPGWTVCAASVGVRS
jgi:hypothetical protein